jgi:hypothetical protein
MERMTARDWPVVRWGLASVAAVFVAFGCTGGPENDDWASADVPPGFPCDALEVDVVEEQVPGGPFSEGEPSYSEREGNHGEWNAYRCTWRSEEGDREVHLDVGLADGFDPGDFRCDVREEGENIQGPGKGDQAQWTWGPNGQAHVQTCGPERTIEVSADRWGEDEEEEARGALVVLNALAINGVHEVHPIDFTD